ncbi:MAG: hypothetical protein GX386_08070 [Clostridiaceae bacterium]|nr:hypothetical protein [Clostridiaceae bacterium]
MDEELIFSDEENESYEKKPGEDIPAENYRDVDIVEEIRELNNVKYYFDLSGNIPENTIKALKTFKRRILLITGGDDENRSYDSLGNILAAKVKHLILIGQTSGLIEMSLMRKLVGKNQGIDIRITHCNTLKQAVDCAFLSAKPGDSVLLSPASNSVSELYNDLKDIYIRYVDAL